MCFRNVCTPPDEVGFEIMISTVLFIEAATSSYFPSDSFLFLVEGVSRRVANLWNLTVVFENFIMLDFLNFSLETTQMKQRLRRLRKYFFYFYDL